MTFQAPRITEAIPLKIGPAAARMAFQIVVTTVLMTVHTTVKYSFTPFHSTRKNVLSGPQIALATELMAVQIADSAALIAFHTGTATALTPFQIAEKNVFNGPHMTRAAATMASHAPMRYGLIQFQNASVAALMAFHTAMNGALILSQKMTINATAAATAAMISPTGPSAINHAAAIFTALAIATA